MVPFNVYRSRLPGGMALLGLALLFECTLAGCNQGTTSDFAKKQQVQEKAAAALTNLGAKVAKANTGLSQNWIVDLSQVPFTSAIADHLKCLGSSVDILRLSKTSIDDSQLADLIDHQTLNGIVELDLSHNSAITDQALDKLTGLLLLSDLNLVGTQVTEAGIARFQERRQALVSKMTEATPLAAAKAAKKDFKIRH